MLYSGEIAEGKPMQYHSIFDPNWIAHISRVILRPFALAGVCLYDIRFAGLIVIFIALAMFPKGRTDGRS